MYIVATFFGDDNFTHLINTAKLDPQVRQEVEEKIKYHPNATFDGSYWNSLQEGYVKDNNIYPITIHALVDVYLE